MTHPYAQAVIESCKKDNSYVVMLKPKYITVSHEKIKAKCEKIDNLGNLVYRYKHNETLISFYSTGKIILKHAPEDVDKFLAELLG